MENPAIENTLGTLCWSIQLLPQIYKSWREKSTDGLSPWLVLIWAFSSMLLGVYVIIQDLNIPLIAQPQCFGFLTLVSWGQCQHYGRGRTRVAATLMTLAVMLAMGGFQVAMVYVVRPSYEQGHQSGILFFGVSACVLIPLGLVPQYVEIYKHKRVVGISLVFIGIDMLGGLFSDLSLIFKPQFDILAGTTYTSVIVFDGIVALCALVLDPWPRRDRRHPTDVENEVPSAMQSESRTIGGCDIPTSLRPLDGPS